VSVLPPEWGIQSYIYRVNYGSADTLGFTVSDIMLTDTLLLAFSEYNSIYASREALTGVSETPISQKQLVKVFYTVKGPELMIKSDAPYHGGHHWQTPRHQADVQTHLG